MRKLMLPVVLTLSAPALAFAHDAPPTPPPTTITTSSEPGVHTHDGFYLRIATGFGSHFESINQEGHQPGVTLSGISSVGELAVGWAVRPGLVLGLGTYSATVMSSDRSFDHSQPLPPTEILDEVNDFNVFGPFCDYYFTATGGLHVQGALGLATVRGLGITDARFDEDGIAVGAGLMVGFGYDWWVSEQWSFGILGRFAVAVATSEDDSGVRWEHGVGASPSLLFTATYN